MQITAVSILLASLAAAAAALPDDKCSPNSTAGAYGVQADAKDIIDTAVAAGSFKTLATALEAAGLVETLKGKGPFTVLAPTDAAFAALPKGTLQSLLEEKNKATLQSILTYHVIPGAVAAADVVKLRSAVTLNGQRIEIHVDDQRVVIDGAQISRTDIRCANGIIHVLDAVILPSAKDVVATAVEAGRFKTLAAALQAAGLVEALQAKGPFTVFAPTDEAFARLPAGTVEKLLLPENKAQLAAILKYHVVPGRVFSDAAAKGAAVETLEGSKLHTRREKDQVYIGDARVISADLDSSNGVIHVIDSVLMPK